MLPGAIVSSAGLPLSVAATSGTTNWFGVCWGMKNSESHAVTAPDASSVARKSICVGGPFGSQPCSSARDHCTRTGRPTALASSAAFGCGVFVSVAAVAAGAFDIDAAHILRRQLEHLCELLAQIMCRLRRRPGCQLAILEFGDGARRPD